ncbi:MAG: tetratricopeptide repeat protein [Flavobacterium sp.]|nr:tetratricopeptide repeat protein [Flavobacterium sp.]
MNKILVYIMLFVAATIYAQDKDAYLPKANKEFAKKKYADAEADYRISESKFPKKAISAYNRGNAIYKIDQPEDAAWAYAKAIKDAKTRAEKHKAYHNLGNVYMKAKNYEQAVQTYKNALINNPNDEQTRYNYALAKLYLKNNPPKKDDKKKDKDKDKNKDKDKDKDKDKNKKDDKGDKDKDKGKPKDDKPKDKGQPKPKEGGISKQRLQNLLDAVNNEEKKVQDKVNKNKVKGKPVKTEKDW